MTILEWCMVVAAIIVMVVGGVAFAAGFAAGRRHDP